jgi:hypothetical protein
MSAHFTYTPDNAEWLTFIWNGGPYIDVVANTTHETLNCINVWDYEKDKPNIPVSLDDFREECDQWVTDFCYPEKTDEFSFVYNPKD